MAPLFPDLDAICKCWLLWREENRRTQTKHHQSKDNKLNPLMTPVPGFQLRPGHTGGRQERSLLCYPHYPTPACCDIFHTLLSSVLSHYFFSKFNTLHWLTWLSPWPHTLLFMSTLMHWCQTVLLNTLWVLNHVIFIYRETMWAPCGQPCECAITFIPVFPWTVTC